MSLVHIGKGTFVDNEPLSDDMVLDATAKDWVPGLKLKFYPYVSFNSLESADYGILATEGKHDAEQIDSENVGEGGFENIAPVTDFRDALESLEEGSKYIFEEFPFVEVGSKDEYMKLLAAQGGEASRPAAKRWSPKGDDGAWDGSGVYDVRDKPPTKSYGSVEEYELQAMETEAENQVDFMFQGDEWKEAVAEIVARQRKEQG